MKTTATGYRINKNGKTIKYAEQGANIKTSFLGNTIKEQGTYYFFNRKQGDLFIYLV